MTFKHVRTALRAFISGGRRRARRRRCTRARRGAVLILVAVCLSLTMTLLGVLLARSRHAANQQSLDARQQQAEHLCQSGAARAAAQLAADPSYSMETWSIPAESLGDKGGASISIQVQQPSEKGPRAIRVVAEYPQESPQRVRMTRDYVLHITSR